MPVNVNYNYTPREVAELLDYLKPRAVIYHRSFGAKFADVLPPASADADDLGRRRQLGASSCRAPSALEDALAQGDSDHDIAPSPDDVMMVCTGGTTGRPKGVMWRQSDIYVVSMNGADHESVDEIHAKLGFGGQPWFAVSPLMHAAGMWTAFAAAPQRAADRPLRQDAFRPACGARDSGAREGRHDDDGRRRLRGTAGRGTAHAVPTTCHRCSRSAPAERRPTRNTNRHCWSYCRRSP